MKTIVVVTLVQQTVVLSTIIVVIVEHGPVSPDMDIMIRLTAKWLIVLTSADKVQTVDILLDVIVVLGAITLIVSFIAHIALLIITETVHVSSLSILFIDDVGLMLVLQLEYAQPIQIESSTHFYIQLLL